MSIPAKDSSKPKVPGSASGSSSSASSAEEDGLSVTQKLIFIGAVVGLCALFIRTRDGRSTSSSGTGVFKEKSMA